MCGINLCFGKDKIELMNAALSHRGIRSKYREIENDLFLGHVRLPIQGLDKEFDHPYTIDNITGAFVGEIFNYRIIDPTAKSDVPVLIRKFHEDGINAFRANKFDGFWSAILHDNISGMTHVITDFLAKKPLYRRIDTVGISSEIKSLLHLGKVTPNRTYFSAVAKWGYCPDNSTPFNEIVKIPPGCHMILDPRGMIYKCYIYDKVKPNSKLDLSEELEKAVKNRVVSDVPISILMSGGLDSTIIYYILRKFVPNLNVFHVDNEEAEFLRYIDFRPKDKITTLSIDSSYDLETILWFNDGPVDLGSMVPQYHLAREISNQGFQVCLSGDGADELCGGYRRAQEYDSQYSDIFHELVFYHLPRLDKMMMSSAVELRSPFLARGVIESAMAVPYENRKSKEILKSFYRYIIPEEIINRKKKPLRFQYNNEWRHKLIRIYKNSIWRNQ